MQNEVHFISFQTHHFFFHGAVRVPDNDFAFARSRPGSSTGRARYRNNSPPTLWFIGSVVSLEYSADAHGIDGVVGKFKGFRVGDISISGPGGWEVRGHAVPCTDVIIDLCFVNTNRDDVRVLEPEKACTIYLMDYLSHALYNTAQDTANIMYRDGVMYEKFGCTGAGSCARL